MKVWLVWVGEYEAAEVAGVYSSRELADAAVRMYGNASTDTWGGDKAYADAEPIEVDAAQPFIVKGLISWRVGLDPNGAPTTLRYMMGPGTGEPTELHNDSNGGSWVCCDAMNEAEAITAAVLAWTSRKVPNEPVHK